MVVGGAPSLVCLWLGLKHMTIIVWHGKSGMLLSWEHREETGTKTSPRQEGNSTIMVSSREDGMHACILNRFSHVQLFTTPWTCSPPGSSVYGILQQESWSGLPCPPPEDLHSLGIEPTSLTFPALASRCVTTSTIWKAQRWWQDVLNIVCEEYDIPHANFKKVFNLWN